MGLKVKVLLSYSRCVLSGTVLLSLDFLRTVRIQQVETFSESWCPENLFKQKLLREPCYIGVWLKQNQKVSTRIYYIGHVGQNHESHICAEKKRQNHKEKLWKLSDSQRISNLWESLSTKQILYIFQIQTTNFLFRKGAETRVKPVQGPGLKETCWSRSSSSEFSSFTTLNYSADRPPLLQMWQTCCH